MTRSEDNERVEKEDNWKGGDLQIASKTKKDTTCSKCKYVNSLSLLNGKLVKTRSAGTRVCCDVTSHWTSPLFRALSIEHVLDIPLVDSLRFPSLLETVS